MSFLLDTCVVSEEIKPRPAGKVRAWLESVDPQSLHLSVVTLTEIRFGILRLSAGAKRTVLENWFGGVVLNLPRDRFLPVDDVIALHAANLVTQTANPDLADIYIAATALVRGFTVVTRNAKDFAFGGLKVFNPWQD